MQLIRILQATGLVLAINISTVSAQTVSQAPRSQEPANVQAFLDHALLFTNCTSDQTKLIRTVLNSGLSKIAAINPPLVADRIAQTKTRQAEFDCDAATKISGTADAETKTRNDTLFFLKASRRQIAKVRIGKVLGTHLSFPLETTLLHEFLHFMFFDNLPTRLHNDGNVVYVNSALYFDVVFSCSVAAFPVENAYYSGGFVSRYGIRTDVMAETCGAAKPYGKVVSVDVGDLKWLGSPLKGSVACYLAEKGVQKSVEGKVKSKINDRSDWAKLSDRCETSRKTYGL